MSGAIKRSITTTGGTKSGKRSSRSGRKRLPSRKVPTVWVCEFTFIHDSSSFAGKKYKKKKAKKWHASKKKGGKYSKKKKSGHKKYLKKKTSGGKKHKSGKYGNLSTK